MVCLLVLALVIMVCVYMRRGDESRCSTIHVCGTKSDAFHDVQLQRKYGRGTWDAWAHDRDVAKHGTRY